jgi:endonuclease/exonuclease/phosphatase family metal-dependent hydrolase
MVSAIMHHGPLSTWNGFDEIIPNRRIDFIFVGEGVRVQRHGILSEITEDGRFPSDHLPVLAEVDIL